MHWPPGWMDAWPLLDCSSFADKLVWNNNDHCQECVLLFLLLVYCVSVSAFRCVCAVVFLEAWFCIV
jgi:hypothetical protein